MKRILLIAGLLSFLSHSAFAEDSVQKAEDITFNWLVKIGDEGGYVDHISHFKKLFSQLKVKTLLEFGVHYSTKYFLDHCNKVISVEFVTGGYGPGVMQKFLELYRDIPNWVPIVYFSGYQGDVTWAPYKQLGSDSVHKANAYQCGTHQSYARVDNFYLSELNAFIGKLVKTNTVEVAFVNPGFYLRGEVVQLLLNKVAIVIAHDTNCRADGVVDDVYGYSRIITPETHEEIFLPGGMGSTVWISKKEQYKDLTEEIKKYAKSL